MSSPQIETTGILTNDARCILAESIESITSKWLIRFNSVHIFNLPIIDTMEGYLAIQVSNTSCSFLPPPNRKPSPQDLPQNGQRPAPAVPTDKSCRYVWQKEQCQSILAPFWTSYRLYLCKVPFSFTINRRKV